MTVSIKNSIFRDGGKQYMDMLTSKEFPEGLGDLSWEFALLSVELDARFEAYKKERELFTKALDAVTKKLVEELGTFDAEIGNKSIKPNTKAYTDYSNNAERIELQDAANKKLEELHSREFTLTSKIIVKVEDLKKLGIAPIVLKVLMPILDIRK